MALLGTAGGGAAEGTCQREITGACYWGAFGLVLLNCFFSSHIV